MTKPTIEQLKKHLLKKMNPIFPRIAAASIRSFEDSDAVMTPEIRTALELRAADACCSAFEEGLAFMCECYGVEYEAEARGGVA